MDYFLESVCFHEDVILMPKYLYFLEFTPKFLITYHSDLFCEISFGTSKNTKLIFSKYSDFKGLVRD